VMAPRNRKRYCQPCRPPQPSVISRPAASGPPRTWPPPRWAQPPRAPGRPRAVPLFGAGPAAPSGHAGHPKLVCETCSAGFQSGWHGAKVKQRCAGRSSEGFHCTYSVGLWGRPCRLTLWPRLGDGRGGGHGGVRQAQLVRAEEEREVPPGAWAPGGVA
jgi:hypothetical protein